MLSNTVKDFKTEGALSPLEILSEEEVQFYRGKLTSFMDDHNWKLNAITRHKPHMYLNWAYQLGHHSKIIESIKPLLGEDILLWYSVLFVKAPQTTEYVPWHQDATYWALNKNEGLTLWLALSDVNPENGCVEYIPGSHLWKDFKHTINNNTNNLLARGQEISNFNGQGVKPFSLKAGQASIHDVSLIHASKANCSDHPRLGIAFRYIPADNYPRTLTFLKRSATLVSGQKKHSHFIDDPNPTIDSMDHCLKAHKKSVKIATIHTLFGDSARSIWKKVLDVGPTLFTKKTFQYIGTSKNKSKNNYKYSVLVTGASSGIGREFCLQLAQQARSIILAGRNLEELKVTAQKLHSLNPQLEIIMEPGDLCLETDRFKLITIAKKQMVDYLVLNAGGGNFAEFIDSNWSIDSKVIDLNISSTVHLCSQLIPQLIQIGRGSLKRSKLVLVSSHASFMRIPKFSVYASCKSFMNNFGLTLVQELKDEPIDILVTCPGATESRFSARAGLPHKMLSQPLNPEVVVRRTLASVGSKNFLIITGFDKLIYLLSRVLPLSFYDRLISLSQKRLLNLIYKKQAVN